MLTEQKYAKVIDFKTRLPTIPKEIYRFLIENENQGLGKYELQPYLKNNTTPVKLETTKGKVLDVVTIQGIFLQRDIAMNRIFILNEIVLYENNMICKVEITLKPLLQPGEKAYFTLRLADEDEPRIGA